MGLDLSPTMFVFVTGLAGLGCGYYAYRSFARKDSVLRSGFWFMWALGSFAGAAGEILRINGQNQDLIRIMDETFSVAIVIGLVLWLMEWLQRNTQWLRRKK